MDYTFVTSFDKKIDITFPSKRTITKRCSTGGTPINLGVISGYQSSYKHSQVVYGSVVVGAKADFGTSFIEFGTATIVLGKGKNKVVHTFAVYRTESYSWTPDLVGFSL